MDSKHGMIGQEMYDLNLCPALLFVCLCKQRGSLDRGKLTTMMGHRKLGGPGPANTCTLVQDEENVVFVCGNSQKSSFLPSYPM